MPSPQTDDTQLALALQAISSVLATGQVPDLPGALKSNADLRYIIAHLVEVEQFAQSAANGDLSRNLTQKGKVAGSLKSLQASLRHLVWQTKMVAQGDFSQRFDFMGEFSNAFNSMVVSLESVQTELQERQGRQATLHRATREISASIDRDQICVAIHKAAVQVMPVDAFAISLLVDQGRAIEDVYLFDAGQRWPGTRHAVGQGLSSFIITTGQTLCVEDVYAAVEELGIDAVVFGDTDRRSLAAVAAAMQLRGKVIGMLSVQAYAPQRYTADDQELAEMLAAYGAAAFENARLYEEALHAQQDAEAANRAKSTFLANMSHELRTPLTAILGFTQLMVNDANLTGPQRDNLGIMTRSGEHLLALINDVLEMSKIEAGRVELHPENFDLRHMLHGLEDMFHLRAKQKGLSLAFELDASVPRYVKTDQGKLRQILINLLSNAVKFTHAGGITLRATTHSCNRDPITDMTPSISNVALHFEVEDSGVGIHPDEVDLLFDPFVQTSSGHRSGEGTGLGLPISRQYVHMLGGDMRVASVPGQGSRFEFDVLLSLEGEAGPSSPATSVERWVVGLASDQGSPEGGPYRLLVAEDDEASRKLLVDLLKSWCTDADTAGAVEIREAPDGQVAVDLWDKWRPHLIWMDIRMPVLNGYEAARLIRERSGTEEAGSGKPVIVAVTAGAFEEERTRILAEGCDDFVRKPYQQAEISGILEKHLGVRFTYQKSKMETQEKVLPPSLSDFSISAEWQADMQQAVTLGDMEWMGDLAEQIRPQAPQLAALLLDWSEAFEFAKILEWIKTDR